MLELMLASLPVAVLILILVFSLIHRMQSKGSLNFDSVRNSKYAGTWYDSDAERLRAQLALFLSNAEQQLPAAEQEVMAIVSPHAGYVYSAKTAAFGFGQAAKSQAVKKVFVLGPSHHMALHGAAISNASVFQTPLGDLQVDEATISELASYPIFSLRSDIHEIEHSLEMQLPFIRHTFGDVRIVPIIIGALHDESEIRLIAEILKGYVQKDDLVVVSSDFTHYGPRYDFAPFGREFQTQVEQLDKEAFLHISRLDVRGFLDFQRRTNDTICGLFPCAVLCAMLPHDTSGTLLRYGTSQEVLVEDNENAVSYLSISFEGPGWPADPQERLSADEAIKLSDEEKHTLLDVAKKAVEVYAIKGSVINATEFKIAPTSALNKCFGAFVTLYKKSKTTSRNLHPGQELRGCIGNIYPVKPLWQSVVDNAISASSRDYRFNPVQPEEMDDIDIEISVLTPPRRVPSYQDIIIGTDGIILSKNRKQSVFLPSVATEFGWDLEETLRQLCVKAGLGENEWRSGAKFDTFRCLSIHQT